jgi:hypothetical protein
MMRVSNMLGATMVAGPADPPGPTGDPARSTARNDARSTRARPDPARGGSRAGVGPSRRPAPGTTWR